MARVQLLQMSFCLAICGSILVVNFAQAAPNTASYVESRGPPCVSEREVSIYKPLTSKHTKTTIFKDGMKPLEHGGELSCFHK